MMFLGLYLTYECDRNCPYCFKSKGEEMISVEDFKIFCDWVGRNMIIRVVLAGGEPTNHPEFARFVRLLRSGPRPDVLVISNLMCEEEKIRAFSHCRVLVNTSVPYSPADRAAFERNLEKLVAAPGTRVSLACTLWRLDQEVDHIIRYCKEFDIIYVRLDFARASILRKNEHVTLDQLPAFKEKALSLWRRLDEMDVMVGFDCNLPAGLFSDDELNELRPQRLATTDPAQVADCGMFYVNPDLTISSCPFRTTVDRRLDDFEDMGDLIVTVSGDVQKRMEQGKLGPFLCPAERFL